MHYARKIFQLRNEEVEYWLQHFRFDLIFDLLNIAIISKCLHKKSQRRYFRKYILRFQYYNAHTYVYKKSNIKISYSRTYRDLLMTLIANFKISYKFIFLIDMAFLYYIQFLSLHTIYRRIISDRNLFYAEVNTNFVIFLYSNDITKVKNNNAFLLKN